MRCWECDWAGGGGQWQECTAQGERWFRRLGCGKQFNAGSACARAEPDPGP